MSNAIINTIEDIITGGAALVSLAEVWEAARDNEHDGPFDAEYVEEYAWNGMNVHVTEEQAQKIVDAEERWNVLCEAGEATQNEWHHLCMELSEQVHG